MERQSYPIWPFTTIFLCSVFKINIIIPIKQKGGLYINKDLSRKHVGIKEREITIKRKMEVIISLHTTLFSFKALGLKAAAPDIINHSLREL